jgi:serine protease Do
MSPVDIFQKYKRQIYGVSERGILRSSGFAVAEGIIVSVSNPLQYPDHITVDNVDGAVMQAQVLGWDNRYDLVVLSVPEVRDFIPAEKLKNIHPGLVTFSMGYDAHGPRIHQGIIAQMLGRKVLPMGGVLSPSIEIDGNLNASMSGGFLIDAEGKIIGMNSTMPRGQGMTIEIDQLLTLVAEIRENGTAKPAYIGITTAPAKDSQGHKGLVITEVEEDSPGQDAGFRTGDLLLSLDGQEVDQPKELFFILRSLAAGQVTEARIQRNGKTDTLSITLGER